MVTVNVSWPRLSVLTLLALCARLDGGPLLFDIGKGQGDLAKRYTAVAADEAYSPERGYGWVPQEEGVIRFAHSDDFADPEKWRKHATRIGGSSKLISPNRRYRGYVGAFPVGHEGSFVYEFAFPAPIETLAIFDTHTIWGGDKPKPNSVTMWTSGDGEAWTVRHRDRQAYYHRKYHADLSADFRGQTKLYVKYHFYAGDKRRPKDCPRGACISEFAIRGTLKGQLVQPSQSIATISASPYTDGPFTGPGGPLEKDGAAIISRATFRADLPPGNYYVEAVSNRATYDLLVHGKPINKPSFPGWRDSKTSRAVAGRISHTGGPFDIEIRGRGQEVRLNAIRILEDPGIAYPAGFHEGRLMLGVKTGDPAVVEGMKILEAAGFEHSPDVALQAIHHFRKAEDPTLSATLLVLGGIGPNVKRRDKELIHVRKALQAILDRDPLNVAVRDLLDDLERLIRGDYKYQHHWWDDIAEESLMHPLLMAVKGRWFYNEWMERGRREEGLKKFRPFIKEARTTYPNDVHLRMYDLERVPWGEEYRAGSEGAPRWAALQRELLGRCMHVFHWWIDKRQRRNGSFGGGLNDDVEALRSWPIAIIALNDPKTQAGAQKLSDGIWNSGILTNGYSSMCWDIQHSAEESSDTQPQFIGVRYGDPEWIWRNMLTLTCMRDVWTAINPLGYRHFRAAYVSATEIDTKGTRGVDVPYATRAVKHGHWLAWYAHYPEVTQLMTEWARAWVAASMRTDRGKPRGVPPAAVDFETGQLGGKGPNWYTPNLGWTYFNWPGMVNAILEQMLLAYTATGDPSFTEPFPAMLELIKKHKDHLDGGLKQGSEAWAAAVLLGNRPDPSSRSMTPEKRAVYGVFGKWRILTGDTRYDDLLREVGDAYTRSYLTGDTTPVEDKLQRALEHGMNQFGHGAMRYNLPMLTSEVKYTDRIFVGGHDVLFSMYTGTPGSAVYCPAYAVTWQDTGRHFAALVRKAERDHLKVQVYSFEDRPNSVGMLVWHMPRGKYRLTWLIHGLAGHQGERDRREIRIRERGDKIGLLIPSRRLFDIELELVAEDEVPTALPDVAIHSRDLSFEPKQLKPGQTVKLNAKVYNIGAADAKACKVRFVAEGPGVRQVIGEVTVGTLPRSCGLKPSTRAVSLNWRVTDPKPRRVRAEVSCDGPQITVRNDVADRPM